MKSNETLQRNVLDAIKWEPMLHAAEIGVTAKDGIITLTGIVDNYAKKMEAEYAAKNVVGVKAVVEKIEVKFGSMWNKGDSEIAADVVSSLKWNWEVPHENLKVKVENGWVTLEGVLPWNFQKWAAQKSVHNVTGVKGVFNNIEIKSETHGNIEKSEIEHAISRNWAINDRDVHVAVSGNGVTLSGSVGSWYQKDEAERIAWNAPGVWTVDNQLEIVYDYLLVD